MAIFNSYVSLPEGSSYNMVRSIDRRFSIDEITSQKMVHYLLTCVFFSPCPDDKLDFLWIMEIQRFRAGLPKGVTDVRFVEREIAGWHFPRDEASVSHPVNTWVKPQLSVKPTIWLWHSQWASHGKIHQAIKNGKPSISIRAIEKPWQTVNVITTGYIEITKTILQQVILAYTNHISHHL